MLGGGKKSKTFVVTNPARDGGVECAATHGENVTISCNTEHCPIDCSGAWGEWQGCSETCGGGVQYQYFSVLTGASHGGVECNFTTGDANEGRSCSTEECPVDCDGAWTAWSNECSASCGGGSHSRHFRIITEAQNGGAACAHVNGRPENATCNTDMCPVDCVGAWEDDWSECSLCCVPVPQLKLHSPHSSSHAPTQSTGHESVLHSRLSIHP